jgi:hypothetical protein
LVWLESKLIKRLFILGIEVGRNIVVNLGDGVFDIGKLEQVSFEAKEELLRLVRNILLKAKTP